MVRLSDPPAPASGSRALLAPGAAFLAVVLLYARTLGYPLVWDDVQLVPPDAAWSGVSGLWRALTSSFWGAYGRAQAQADFYRPVASVSFWLDHGFWAGRALGFHLTNVLAGAAGAALVAVLARRRGAGMAGAALAGLLFAAHPLHAESVPFVSDRTDLLALDFLLLFLLLWPARGEPWRAGRAAAALLALLLSLGAKEMALLAPLAVAWDAWLTREGAGKGAAASARVPGVPARAPAVPGRTPATPHPIRLGHYAWLLLPVALFLFARAAVMGGRGALPEAATRAVAGIGPTLLLYGRLLLWPFGASAEYPYPPSLQPWEVAAGAVAALALAALAVWPRVPRQVRWAAGLTILFTLPGALPGLAAARFLYFATAFLCLALAAVPTRLPRAGPALLAAVAAVFAVAVWARTPVWNSAGALFEDCARRSPGSARAWVNLGVARLSQDRLEEAESALKRALALQPDHDKALSNLALVLRRQGRLGEAEAAGRHAVRLEPGNADARFNLATVLQAAGRPAEAAQEFGRGLALRDDPRARLGRALALSEAGDHAAALAAYGHYLRASPGDSSDTRGSMAWELYRLGRLEEAEAQARVACATRDPSPISVYNLGLVLLARGREAQALEAYRRGVELDSAGAGWASAAGDIVDLLRSRSGPPAAHVALGLIAGRAGLTQAQAAEGRRYLRAAPSGPWSARAAGWASRLDPALAAGERGSAGPPGSPREDLRRLLWGE
ncbi:MAG: tetratricopeptide repeat protein [Candidatus Eisenbacteria bacterium]|nr:tetratricopeptide repeat protein [Candidatus Eisenbacteria bacterium]